MGERSKITIRTMRPEDFAGLERLQCDCYPTLDSRELKRVEHFESQYKVFPEGQFVAIDGDRASGETYCTAHHIYRVDGAPMNLTMFIRYQDRWVRDGGRWWFEERRLCVDWERRAPLGDEGWA